MKPLQRGDQKTAAGAPHLRKSQVKLRDRIDELFLSSVPHVPLPIAAGVVERWLDTIGGRYPVLREARRVLPTGSGVAGTAVEGSSGLDLVLVFDRFENALAHRAIDYVGGALSERGAIRMRHGVQVIDSEVGKLCFLPARLPSPRQGIVIADGFRDLWLPAIPGEHAEAVRAQDELSRCAIRVAKCWSVEYDAKLDPFHVEAIALESLTRFSGPHFHWKMKSFFDTAHESLSAQRGHPLCPERVRFDYLSTDERRVALDSIETAAALANQAFLLAEIQFKDDDSQELAENLQSAVSAYALLVDRRGGR